MVKKYCLFINSDAKMNGNKVRPAGRKLQISGQGLPEGKKIST